MGLNERLTAKAVVSGSFGASLLVMIANSWLLSTASSGTPILSFVAGLGVLFLATLAGAATLGLFWHHVASSHGWRSVHAYWAPGLFAGAVVAAAPLGIPAIGSRGALDGVFPTLLSLIALYGASLGGLTGLFAWLIRRPDRDAPNPATSSP